MEIRRIHVERLKDAFYNPRKDLRPGDPEYEKLRRAIETFGYVEPIVWNERTGNIVGGHQRVKVLKQLGYIEVDAVVVDLDEAQERTLNLALNRVTGEWDNESLAVVMRELERMEADLSLTGFDPDEIEKLLAEHAKEVKPEVEFSEEIMLEHNYVVLYFDNPFDWQVAVEKFGLKEVKDLCPRKGQPTGIGRVLRGKDWLERIT